MPHQCTSCEEVLPDGSRKMIGGCPRCGGNRFRFLPDGKEPEDPSTADSAEPDQDFIIASETPPSERQESISSTGESRAQVDARSGMISPDELPPSPTPTPDNSSTSDMPTTDTQTKAALKEELEDAFGSIRIVERGEYELNLMELYERDACIIQLEEDGRYMIDVPEMFGDVNQDPNG